MSRRTQNTEEEDEVVAEYDVYITPETDIENIYLMQYPTRQRTKPYNERERSAPTEMRVKPESGFMELDVSLNTMHSFDRKKGLQWGEALRSTKDMGISSFGLPAGFGKGNNKMNDMMTSERTNPLDDAERMDQMLRNFERSVSDGKVLQTQTLGGQIIKSEPGRPMYMLGAFRKNELHLSTVAGVVQMRPQFHHLDAKGQLTKLKQSRDRAATENMKPAESKLITQRAVMAEDEELNIKQTEDFLDRAAREQWIKLKYQDEDSEEAYSAYAKALFVPETENSEQLVSPWNNDQFLDAISIPRIETGARIRKKPPLTRSQMADMRREAEDDEAAQNAEEERLQAAEEARLAAEQLASEQSHGETQVDGSA